MSFEVETLKFEGPLDLMLHLIREQELDIFDLDMEVLTDQKTKDLIWRKGDTMFYKGGVTDPDYCVLRFTASSGRYYCDLKTESFEVR